MTDYTNAPKAASPLWKKPAFRLILAVLAAALGIWLYFQFAAPMPETAPARQADELTGTGYVYITAGEESRWFPLPEKETILKLERGDMINEIKFMTDGVCMHTSTCDNQDCVMQGTVTLENKKDRVLRNIVICLPNQVAIELYSREEVLASMAAQ